MVKIREMEEVARFQLGCAFRGNTVVFLNNLDGRMHHYNAHPFSDVTLCYLKVVCSIDKKLSLSLQRR